MTSQLVEGRQRDFLHFFPLSRILSCRRRHHHHHHNPYIRNATVTIETGRKQDYLF